MNQTAKKWLNTYPRQQIEEYLTERKAQEMKI